MEGSRASSGPTGRVRVYVDGFNLYYGLKSKGWRRLYWVDLAALSARLLRGDQRLVGVRYFTARISGGPPDKRRRQTRFLRALETLPNLTMHYGHFLQKTRTCTRCSARWTTYEEKMTDVNVAVQLLGDAQDDDFDTTFVLSADSDLAGPIEAVLERYPNRRVIVAFPPGRHSEKLRSVASGSFTLGRKLMSDCQFPDKVVRGDGSSVTRPASWR
ncbi:MAG: NYN domain-containing protein [Gammaproteobacteria bacterium]|nr:NYN domain-containing protein [Gammaproteobacteria bacterium]